MISTYKETNREDYNVEKCLHHNQINQNTIFPVVDNDGITYRNLFCARCNFKINFTKVAYEIETLAELRNKNTSIRSVLGHGADNRIINYFKCVQMKSKKYQVI